MTTLPTIDVPLSDISPNPWNPNEMTERQFEAERESLMAHGFIVPVLLRPKDEGYEVVDGEHRFRTMVSLVEDPEIEGDIHPQLLSLIEAEVIPAVVLDLDDAQAKKLTVTLNETRGQANVAKRAALLADLADELDMADLLLGLPWSEREMTDMLSVGNFDWSALDAPDDGDFGERETSEPKRVTIVVDVDDELVWSGLCERWREGVGGGDPRRVSTAVLKHILSNIKEIPEP